MKMGGTRSLVRVPLLQPQLAKRGWLLQATRKSLVALKERALFPSLIAFKAVSLATVEFWRKAIYFLQNHSIL